MIVDEAYEMDGPALGLDKERPNRRAHWASEVTANILYGALAVWMPGVLLLVGAPFIAAGVFLAAVVGGAWFFNPHRGKTVGAIAGVLTFGAVTGADLDVRPLPSPEMPRVQETFVPETTARVSFNSTVLGKQISVTVSEKAVVTSSTLAVSPAP